MSKNTAKQEGVCCDHSSHWNLVWVLRNKSKFVSKSIFLLGLVDYSVLLFYCLYTVTHLVTKFSESVIVILFAIMFELMIHFIVKNQKEKGKRTFYQLSSLVNK